MANDSAERSGGRGVFVTATGTNVGKTTVVCGLARALRRSGADAVPMKPVQTGCEKTANGYVAPDLRDALAACGWTPPPEEVADLCLFAYEPACSPHLAARLEGRAVEVNVIVAAAQRLCRRHELVLCEGAGGLLVPLNETETILDLMARLSWPTLLVTRAGLGAINETLLSLRALRSAGLDCIGVVVNDRHCEGDTPITRDNPDAIERFGGVPVLARIPYLDDAPSAAAWHKFDEAFPLPVFLAALKKRMIE